MPPPMMGSWTVEVRGVKPFTIHGDLYYEVVVDEPESAGAMVGLRVPQHAINGEPRVGERLVVTFLMGQVTKAARA
jgi:hypothetical protein